MNHYAKIIAAQSKRKRFLVEIWSTSPIGESSYDEIKDYKSFWTLNGAQKWIIKQILRYNLQASPSHIFITDDMIFRKEI